MSGKKTKKDMPDPQYFRDAVRESDGTVDEFVANELCKIYTGHDLNGNPTSYTDYPANDQTETQTEKYYFKPLKPLVADIPKKVTKRDYLNTEPRGSDWRSVMHNANARGDFSAITMIREKIVKSYLN